MSESKNPFFDDDEVDDNEFLRHHPQGQHGYMLGNDPSAGQANSDWELRQKLLLEERRRIEERTLQSAQSSLGIIHESEQVGVATAEELVRQHEQLQNVERNLDSISSTMRISQKHINSIKSVFGGIKSFFGGKNATDASRTNQIVSPTKPQSSGLQETIGTLKETQMEYSTPHPALRIRGVSYDDDEDETDFVKVERSRSVDSSKNYPSFEEKLDKNLEDIGMGLGRLKNLAIGLHDEIQDQNEMLDRLYTKADHTDETLEYQNRQIKRILKK